MITKQGAEPKKPRTAYYYFHQEIRPQIIQAHPGLTANEITSIVAGAYRKLSQTEKCKYEALAADDYRRYDIELKKYESFAADEKIRYPTGFQEKMEKKNYQRLSADRNVLIERELREETEKKKYERLAADLNIRFERELREKTEKKKYERLATDDKIRHEKEIQGFGELQESPNEPKKRGRPLKKRKEPLTADYDEMKTPLKRSPPVPMKGGMKDASTQTLCIKDAQTQTDEKMIVEEIKNAAGRFQDPHYKEQLKRNDVSKKDTQKDTNDKWSEEDSEEPIPDPYCIDLE